MRHTNSYCGAEHTLSKVKASGGFRHIDNDQSRLDPDCGPVNLLPLAQFPVVAIAPKACRFAITLELVGHKVSLTSSDRISGSRPSVALRKLTMAPASQSANVAVNFLGAAAFLRRT